MPAGVVGAVAGGPRGPGPAGKDRAVARALPPQLGGEATLPPPYALSASTIRSATSALRQLTVGMTLVCGACASAATACRSSKNELCSL